MIGLRYDSSGWQELPILVTTAAAGNSERGNANFHRIKSQVAAQ